MSVDKYVLQLADNCLIHAHRLGQWCGYAPILEIDMSLTNFALDNIGACRSLYQYASELLDNGATEDSLAYLRTEREFRNVLLVEQPNGDFAHSIAKCFFFDAFQVELYTILSKSTDLKIAGIAEKSLKEVRYHYKYSSEWVLRLGDGTPESKVRMQKAIDYLMPYCGEMFNATALEQEMLGYGIGADLDFVKSNWTTKVNAILEEATLVIPEPQAWSHNGGKNGLHSEHMGYILAELQYLQRAYPGAEW